MRWLINNWPLKIVSLILSLVLWFYVSGESKMGIGLQPKERIVNQVAVKLLSSPEEDMEVNFQPDKVRVILKGSPQKLREITESDILLFVGVGKLEEGEYELLVEGRVPEGVRIGKIIPANVKVTLKRSILEGGTLRRDTKSKRRWGR